MENLKALLNELFAAINSGSKFMFLPCEIKINETGESRYFIFSASSYEAKDEIKPCIIIDKESFDDTTSGTYSISIPTNIVDSWNECDDFLRHIYVDTILHTQECVGGDICAYVAGDIIEGEPRVPLSIVSSELFVCAWEVSYVSYLQAIMEVDQQRNFE